MGTRGLTLVTHNGHIQVAQYGQYDHYPAGQGFDIVNFLQKAIPDKFTQELTNTHFIDAERLHERITNFRGKEKDNLEILRDTPQFHRDTGANILWLIYQGNVKELQDNREFVDNKLFCEWWYHVDLDDNKLWICQNHFTGEPGGDTSEGYTRKVSFTFSELRTFNNPEGFEQAVKERMKDKQAA